MTSQLFRQWSRYLVLKAQSVVNSAPFSFTNDSNKDIHVMKIIKVILVVVLTLVGVSFSTPAQQRSKSFKLTSPRAIVVSLYRQHKKRSPFFQTRSRALLDRYFTRELADLIWQDAHSSGGEVGALDGDPLFNAQDMEIKNFSVHEGTVAAQAGEVPVSFTNFGEKHQILFRLVAERAGWKIANIEYDDGATLVGILKSDSTEPGQAIRIYLVAVGDDGKTGKKIGCGDSLLPVTRTIKKTAAPLTATLQEVAVNSAAP